MKAYKITGSLEVTVITDGKRTTTKVSTKGNLGCQLLGSIKTLRYFDDSKTRLFDHSQFDLVEDMVYNQLAKHKAVGFEEGDIDDNIFINQTYYNDNE